VWSSSWVFCLSSQRAVSTHDIDTSDVSSVDHVQNYAPTATTGKLQNYSHVVTLMFVVEMSLYWEFPWESLS